MIVLRANNLLLLILIIVRLSFAKDGVKAKLRIGNQTPRPVLLGILATWKDHQKPLYRQIRGLRHDWEGFLRQRIQRHGR